MCKIFRSLAHSQTKLHCIKVKKLNVCGSLVFSNPVTIGRKAYNINSAYTNSLLLLVVLSLNIILVMHICHKWHEKSLLKINVRQTICDVILFYV